MMSGTAETIIINERLEKKVEDDLDKSKPTDGEEVKTNQVFFETVKLHTLTNICWKKVNFRTQLNFKCPKIVFN